MSALRNTTYEVGGDTVKLNTIVAESPADLEEIYKSLLGMKPKEFLVRGKGLVYEFVGPNEAMDAMRQARDKLAAGIDAQ